MTGFGRFTDENKALAQQSGYLRIVDELFGYSVRPGAYLRRRATMVEWSAYFVGFSILFGIVGLLATSAGASAATLDAFVLTILVCGAGLAGFFFWVGFRGTAIEAQVDIARRELRTAVRNWRGQERILETHAFAEIESMFVHRKGQSARLCVRTVQEPAGVEIVAADNATLKFLHEVMSGDIAADRPRRKAAAAKRVKSEIPQWAQTARAAGAR